MSDELRLRRRFANVDGTGLGLPICRWIARARGGDITVKAGSRFVIDLPRLAGE